MGFSRAFSLGGQSSRRYISAMETLVRIIPYLVYVAMFGTLAVLFVGVISLARGGAFHDKYSNKLMRMRVGLQALALALFALLLLISKYIGPPGGAAH